MQHPTRAALVQPAVANAAACDAVRRRRSTHVLGGALALASLALVGTASAAHAQTFTVTNVNDANAGSLRRAITDANANQNVGGNDRIDFNIPGNGRHSIVLASDLPAITDPVTIRGYSQPGSAKAVPGVAASVTVIIDASAADNGLVLQTDGSIVRGLVVIAASGGPPDGVGIRVTGDRNTIAGSIVGLDGINVLSFVLGNDGDGIEVVGDDNVIGGAAPDERNVIAANGKLAGTEADGVSIVGHRNQVLGNTIGMDPLAVGDGQSGNSDAGVRLAGDDNVVDGNIISANGIGIAVESGTGNRLVGNLVGTDASGGVARGNSRGIVVEASRTTIGDGFDGNVIAGTTTGAGIELDGDRNTVKANKVGTDSAGAVALPNLGGIRVSGSRNVIGGTGFLADNLISGNAFYGIELVAPGYANEVEGNLIGLEAFGVDPLPNGGPGIRISGSDGNVIGGLAARQANSIAFNAGDGVHVESGAGNAISGNAIGGNGGLAIDLDLDGPAPNDAPGSGDADTGANGLQNHPLVTAAETVAVFGGVRTDVQWELDSAPSTSYRIELYANATCDASGSGEASTLIGTLAVATDATGHAAGVVTADVVVQPGDVVAATATATTGLAPGGTSELSPCRVVT